MREAVRIPINSDFCEDVYRTVRKIPSGTVATYGQIAALSGHPGAARAVGNALHKNPDGEKTPCFRVIHGDGRLSDAFCFGGILEHKARLEADGVRVVNLRVDLSEYLWDGREAPDEA